MINRRDEYDQFEGGICLFGERNMTNLGKKYFQFDGGI